MKNPITLSDLHAHTVLVAMDELRKAVTAKTPDSEALAIIEETDRELRRQLPRQAVSVRRSE